MKSGRMVVQVECLLGVDLGTSGARAALVDSNGKLIFSTHTDYGYEVPESGWAEQDVNVYWGNACEVIKRASAKAVDEGWAVSGVCISGLAPDVIPVDKNGNPLGPAILWLDRRATEEEQWIKDYLGEDAVFSLSGNMVDSYFGLVKAVWLRRKRPDIYCKAYKLLNVVDYVVYKLTGTYVTDYCHAACMGIAFDLKNRRWNKDAISVLGLDIDKLPKLRKADDIAGTVTPEASMNTGLREGTPIAVGCPDGIANFISAGLTQRGDSAASLGTSGLMAVLSESERFVKRMLISPSISSRSMYYNIAAPAFTGGAYKWIRNNIYCGQAKGAYDVMNEEAAQVAPGSEGLVLLPYLVGERTPVWDSRARGVLFGISDSHTRATIFRAGLESIALAFLDNVTRMRDSGAYIGGTLTVTGGGAKSALLRQILADALNMRVNFIGSKVSAEMGGAFIAGKAIGLFPSYEVARDSVTVIETAEPDPANTAIYHELYTQIYSLLYPSLKDLFEAADSLRSKLCNQSSSPTS